MNPRILPALGLVLVLGSCAPKGQHGSVEIFQACSPPSPDTTTGACLYPTGSCSIIPLDTFAFDAVGADTVERYMFVGYEVHNQLASNADTTTGAGNTHIATIDSYTVSYSGIAARNSQVNVNYTVPANGSTVIGVRLVDIDSAKDMLSALGSGGQARIVANLTLHGHYNDGASFDSSTQPYGIDVCVGCMAPATCPNGSPAITCPADGQWPLSMACSASGGSSGSGFSLGGSISGFTTGTLVLRDSVSGQTLSLSAPRSSFTFGTKVSDGASYNVSVMTSPSGLTCDVSSGATGTVGGADVTTIRISCS